LYPSLEVPYAPAGRWSPGRVQPLVHPCVRCVFRVRASKTSQVVLVYPEVKDADREGRVHALLSFTAPGAARELRDCVGRFLLFGSALDAGLAVIGILNSG
jgi:hypothetical protein